MTSATKVLVDGGEKKQQHSRPVIAVQSPRSSSHRGENQNDREATRCELERLLTTAGTDDKKQIVKQALDHLQDDSSIRGTALAVIVNDTLAMVSAAVASSKKRHKSFAGDELSAAKGRFGPNTLHERRRFDRDNFEVWRPNDQIEAAVRAFSSESTSAETGPSTEGQESPTSIAGRSIGDPRESGPQQPARRSSRRFTAMVLPSIPEHRVLGRRVFVKETAAGGVERQGIEPGQHELVSREGLDGRGAERGTRREEQEEKTLGSMANGGGGAMELGSPSTLAYRQEKVSDVPRALLGEATSTGVDPSHPPCAAVDGVLASFWLSTGLFPQTLTIRLARPVAIYEVMVACGGVSAARVHLGHISSGGGGGGGSRTIGSDGGSGTSVDGDGYYRDERFREGRRKECSLLELVRERQRPSAAGTASAACGNGYGGSGSSMPVALMTFRVPGGGGCLAEKVDRLSLVVTSARAPFCLVTSVVVRGKFSEEDNEDDDDDGEGGDDE